MESVPAEHGWLFLRIDEGFGYWMGPESGVDLPTGSVLVLPPGGSGVIRASSLCECQGRAFALRIDALAGVLTLHEVQALASMARHSKNGSWTFQSTDAVSDRFNALGSGGTGNVARRVRILAVAAELVDGMLSAFPVEPPAGAVLGAADRFRKLVTEIPESELLNRSADELSRECHCSPRHLNRLFREQFGVSMRTKLTELRLRRARDLLRETDAKVINIAFDSGYRHLSLFNSMFKRYLGMTPTQWRESVARKKPRPRLAKRATAFVT